MAKARVKLNLQGLTDQELVQRTRTVVTQSTAHPAAASSPITLAQLTTRADLVEAKEAEIGLHNQHGLVLTSELATLRTSLLDGLSGFGGYIDIVAAGD